MAGEHVLELTDANFEAEVMRSDLPVLVDFGADWCIDCRMIASTIDEIAAEYLGRAKVGKLDNAVDSLPPGGQVSFRCSFNPGEKGFLVSSVKDWVIRVWARK